MEALDLVFQPNEMHDMSGNTLQHHFLSQARRNTSIFDSKIYLSLDGQTKHYHEPSSISVHVNQ